MRSVRLIKKILLCCFVFLTLGVSSFSASSQIKASENFETTLSTHYTITGDGVTNVTHLIELKNRTPTMYATQYGLKVSSPNLKNIVVKSNGQLLKPAIATTENQTSIGITFTDTILGQGKVRTLEISYQDLDAAVISGKVLEVMVPKIANADEYDAYRVTIETPASYGKPNRVTPTDFSTEEATDRIITRFQLHNGEGVVALFGTQQVFNLELIYQLENSSSNTGLAQIALPPDTAFQKVWYNQLEPRPQSIAADIDGNWIATYQIPPQQTIHVKALGHVLTSLEPTQLPPKALTTDHLKTSQEYWPTTDQAILDIVRQRTQARQLYDFAIDTLSYNYQAIDTDAPRLGAAKALADPQLATCQEYTDVFVTLARAAGIPSRRVTGYAYTQNNLLRPLEVNSDILHAWPEFYDEERHMWHPVDPTWGDTTGGVNYFDQFDLNHITFAINGSSSTLPFPAGAYKASTQPNEKTVSVTFGKEFPSGQPALEIQLQPTMTMGVPLPGTYTLKVTNQQGRAWYNTQIIATSEQGVPSLPQTIEVPQILPFETVDVPLQLFGNKFWQGQTSDLQLAVSYVDDQNQKTRQTIQLNPLVVKEGGYVPRLLSFPGTIPGLVIGSISLALFSGSLLVRRRKR